MNPLVSVIIPCHNDARVLERCLGSVAEQRMGSWEALVVENGSRDGSGEIASRFQAQDERFRLLQRAEKLGPAAARNLGIEKARGRYLAFLDGDDWWASSKLESQIGFMKENGIALSHTWYRKVKADGRFGGIVRSPKEVGFKQIRKSNFLGCSTVVYDSTMVGKRYFPEEKREDWILWLKIIGEGHLAQGIPEVLAFYRGQPLGRAFNKRIRMIKAQWSVYRNHVEANVPESLFLFASHFYFGLVRNLAR